MNWLNQILEHYPNLRYVFLLVTFAVTFVVLIVVYNFISKKLQRRAEKISHIAGNLNSLIIKSSMGLWVFSARRWSFFEIKL